MSNRWGPAAAALVRWHWAKAGTLKAVHDVTKNELAAGLPPSGQFGANAAWYRVALLTYNVCTVLRRRALPARFYDARPQRLRYEVFTLPAALVAHARQLTAQLGVPPLTAEELVTARRNLRALCTPLRTAEGSAKR
ncbi:MAG TPA: hypothetical protein VLT62_03420 [Candidatus Methylomirabilis sp.]|nr:hypothetical protein [Candidatus Methylomirabilis sp.]